MALFKIFKGKVENLPLDIHEGYAYLTTDTGELYVDVDASTRKQISAEKLSRTRDGFTETIEIDDLILMQDQIEDINNQLSNGVLPAGGSDGQVLKRKGTNEVEFGLAEQIEDVINQKPISFKVTGIEGEEFTIEFTEDGEGGSGGVESFNGRAGVVEPQTGDYTADMVGARPDTWMPTAAEVGARPDSWTPTADEVGAVPTTRTVNGKSLSSNVSLVAGDVGALPISGGTLTGPLNCGGRLLRGVANPVSGQDAVNLQYAQANFAPKDSAGGSGKRTCRFVIGTSTSGWTEDDCDYLCDGTDDQVEINAAIQALPSGGGEIVILDGTYNITATIAMNKDNVKLSGNGNATVLKRMWHGSTETGVIKITATNGGCFVGSLMIDGNNYSTSSDSCIFIQSSNKNIVVDIICHRSGVGIFLMYCKNNFITLNIANNNKYYGIRVYESVNNIISYNIFNNNNTYGIYTTGSNYNIISSNTCCDNDPYGIYLFSSNNNTITNNTSIRGTGSSSDYTSSQHTIYVNNSQYNLISANNIMGKNYTLSGGTGNTFVNNKYN